MNLINYKSFTDRSLAGIGLLLATPILVIVSLLIWLDEPKNVLFAQTRLGLNGKPFRLLKFRKFSAKCGDAGPGVTVVGDVRMTAIGAILERTKLDELPQLWNIFKGDMSFVGPRPESMRFADMYQGECLKLLDFLPGLFGPCQIAFRNESTLYPVDEDPEVFYRRVLFPQKAKVDLDYFSKSNWAGDLSWILRGLWVTLAGAVHWPEVLATYGKTLTIDIVIVLMSWAIAILLHFSTFPQGSDFHAFVFGLWVFPPTVISGLIAGGCYRRYGEGYFYFADALKLISVTSISLALAFMTILAFEPINASFQLLVTEWLVLLFGLNVPRIWSRYQSEKMLSRQKNTGLPVLVYGANSSVAALSNWLTLVRKKRVMAFFDDESKTHGKQLMGIPVLSRINDILTFQAEHKASELWVARQLSEEQKIKITNFCLNQNITLMMLPEIEPFGRLNKNY